MSSIEIYFQLITVFDGVRQTDLYKRESVQNNETNFACKTTALFSFFNHVCVHECVRVYVCMYVCVCVCVLPNDCAATQSALLCLWVWRLMKIHSLFDEFC